MVLVCYTGHRGELQLEIVTKSRLSNDTTEDVAAFYADKAPDVIYFFADLAPIP